MSKVSLRAAELKIEIKYPDAKSSVLLFLSKSTGNTKYLIKYPLKTFLFFSKNKQTKNPFHFSIFYIFSFLWVTVLGLVVGFGWGFFWHLESPNLYLRSLLCFIEWIIKVCSRTTLFNSLLQWFSYYMSWISFTCFI